MKFYKAIIQVTVLSETPIENVSLKDIAYQIEEGDSVGEVKIMSHKEISSKAAAKEAIKLGSDPEFFCIDEDGNSTI